MSWHPGYVLQNFCRWCYSIFMGQISFHEDKMARINMRRQKVQNCIWNSKNTSDMLKPTIGISKKAGKKVLDAGWMVWTLSQSQWECLGRIREVLWSKQHLWNINPRLVCSTDRKKGKSHVERSISKLCWYSRNSWVPRLSCVQYKWKMKGYKWKIKWRACCQIKCEEEKKASKISTDIG